MTNLLHVDFLFFFFFFSFTRLNGNNWGFHESTINSKETLDNFFYLGQFGRRRALRDDCQAAVLLHRQAGEAAAECGTGMSNQNNPPPLFFHSLNLRAWIEIFSLKTTATRAFTLPANLCTSQQYESRLRTEQRAALTPRLQGRRVEICCTLATTGWDAVIIIIIAIIFAFQLLSGKTNSTWRASFLGTLDSFTL